jgi:hypothetical protein
VAAIDAVHALVAAGQALGAQLLGAALGQLRGWTWELGGGAGWVSDRLWAAAVVDIGMWGLAGGRGMGWGGGVAGGDGQGGEGVG